MGRPRSWMLGCLVTLVLSNAAMLAGDERWPRHTIDGSSRGADGVRLADVDGDGRPDVVTGWEEGGVIRICRHPGANSATQPWPSVTVGSVKSPEDAVFADLNGDGSLDVVSCCEGRTRSVFAHWAPAEPSRYWDPSAWSTSTFDATAGQQAWMFCLPEFEAGNGGRQSPVGGGLQPVSLRSLIVGSKGAGASISRMIAAGDPRSSGDWKLRRLCNAGWIMSLRSVDMDGDGDADVLLSDRKGAARGIAWLERPAEPENNQWPRHIIGGTNEEVMFLDVGDLTADGIDEVVAATRSAGVLLCRRGPATDEWTESMIAMPPGCGTGKGIAIGDVDRDGQADLVVSCENAAGRHGVFWLARRTDALEGDWQFHAISGDEEGVKFDRLELLDLDADGDLDVMTCEERDNLGVIWYANPLAL